MWSSISVILVAAVGIRAQEFTSTTGCLCVHYRLCAKNNTIITDGSNLIGGRGGPAEYEECVCPNPAHPNGQRCGDPMLLCCQLPGTTPEAPHGKQTTLEPTTEEPEEELSWDDCGNKGFNPADVTGRVIASEDESVTFSGEFPWMAMVLNKSDNSMVCGGSVLHHHVIMTAAHCVRRFLAHDVVVRVGVWHTADVTQTVEVERILRHGQFRYSNYWNDIALLVLRQGLQISDKVQPICLPTADTLYDNMRCMATGWGVSAYAQRNMSEILRKVDLKIIPHAQCQRQLRRTRLSPFFKLHNSFVCANGVNNNTADTCTGDGGGPLICLQRGTGKYVQVGIVAAGLECGTGIPALYANVPLLKPWIDQQFEEWHLESLEF